MICDVSHAPDHPNLQVTFWGTPHKKRKTFLISGLSTEVNYASYDNTIVAAECAVKERVLYVLNNGTFSPPPTPLAGSYPILLGKYQDIFKKNSTFCNPMTILAFAESYQAPKRGMYLRAIESLNVKPFTEKDAAIKAFLKFEKYNFKPSKRVVPRIISPRNPRFTVSLGRYVKPIEKRIYKIIDMHIYGSPTVMKGLNQYQRGKVISDHWGAFLDPIAIGIDAKRFDQHVSLEALRWEHSIYKLFYPKNKEFNKLLKLQEHNKCFLRTNDGSLKYTTIGGRMSGDVNTSCGNVLIACSLVKAYADFLGVNIRMVNDGDDCVIFMESKHEEVFRRNLNTWFIKSGFQMEVEPTVSILEQIVFCQSQPVFDGTQYLMVRDPRTHIAKDCVALKPLDNPSISKMWMASVGKCGLSLTGGIPICSAFYGSLVRGSCGSKILRDPTMNKYHFLGTGMDRSAIRDILPSTRYSFWLAFGICPDEQVACEKFYETVELSSSIVDKNSFVYLPM